MMVVVFFSSLSLSLSLSVCVCVCVCHSRRSVVVEAKKFLMMWTQSRVAASQRFVGCSCERSEAITKEMHEGATLFNGGEEMLGRRLPTRAQSTGFLQTGHAFLSPMN